MRSLRALLGLVPLLALSGCGYVHFGKTADAPTGDTSLDVAYSNLSTQHKILQQELALARKEGDTLRAALDNRGDGAASTQLTTRLTETTRELAALRASYAKLQAARPGVSTTPDPEVALKLSLTEEKLANTLRSFTQLQEENAKLKQEVDSTRAENTTLTAQVKTVTAQNEQAQSALAQLNTELLAQKEARARAEQQTEAARTQLGTIIAARDATQPASLADARQSSAASTAVIETPAKTDAALKIDAAPPADKPSTAELRISPERLRTKAGQTTGEKSPAPSQSGTRTHVVQVGDTLEKLAQKYYGDPGKWNVIYFANNAQLSGGRPLKAGMELEIPEK